MNTRLYPKYHKIYKRACYEDNKDLIELIMLNMDDNNKAGLIGACKGENIQLVKYFLDYDDKYYIHCFSYACYIGNIEIINMFLNLDLKFPFGSYNTISQFYDSGLRGACKGGHLNIVKMLIELGATNYMLAMEGACEGGHMEIINYIMNIWDVDLNHGLQGACLGGHDAVIKMMISLGANNYSGGLAYACIGGHIAVVKMMIDLGGLCGLGFACEGGNIEIVKMIIELNKTKGYTYNNYNWELESAYNSGNVEIIKLIIDLFEDIRNIKKIENNFLECRIFYIRLTGKNIDLPIKTQHPEYHLLRVYGKKIPDIDRIINKYLF